MRKLILISPEWLESKVTDLVWRIRADARKVLLVDFNTPLPDGTLLTSPINARVLDAIQIVLLEMRSGPDSSSDCSYYQTATAGTLINLACWMNLRGISDFKYLHPEDVREFVRSMSAGMENCLEVPRRFSEVLEQWERDHRPGDPCPKFTELLGRAMVPASKRGMLPISARMFLKKMQVHGLSPRSTLDSVDTRSDLKVMSYSRVVTVAWASSRLWHLRKALDGNGLSEDPFPEGHIVFSRGLSRPTGRTADVPVETAVRLIDAAVKTVIHFGPALLTAREELIRIRALHDKQSRAHKAQVAITLERLNQVALGCGARAPINQRGKKGRSGIYEVSFRLAINTFLPVAAMIVIGVFTARRRAEILGLEIPAISGSDEDGWWLRSMINKTLQSHDRTPAPKIVQLAVRLLERWGGEQRPNGSDPRLFLVPRKTDSKPPTIFTVEGAIDRFAAFTGVFDESAKRHKEHWHFSPHQFRKLFAVLYVWRYRHGDLGSLSFQLRHTNLDMTRRYASRPAELAHEIVRQQKEFTVGKLVEIAAGEPLRGTGGITLARHIERLRSRVEIEEVEDVEDLIRARVDSGSIVLRGTPLMLLCAARGSPPALRRAACQRQEKPTSLVDGLPDASAAAPELCENCMFAVADTAAIRKLENDVIKLGELLEGPLLTSTVSRQSAETRVASIKKFLGIRSGFAKS